MTLRRKDIMAALQVVISGLELGDVLFPPFEVDGEDLDGWRDVGGGLQDSGNLLSGKFTPTINSGPENQWEGVRECTLAYGIIGADKASRVAQRDLLVPALETVLAADRTIGSGDPQVYAELGEAEEDDKAPLADAAIGSLAIIPIHITYVAASAAG